MTNEELVALIQAGERDRLPELWNQVERFVAMLANRRLVQCGPQGGAEFDDLYNSGYLAMVKAVETYDPERGAQFATHLTFYLKTAFAEASGCRSRKQANDPLHRADSLDRPLDQEGADGDTLAALVADPEDVMEEAVERIWREQLHAAVEDALDALPEGERETVRRRYYQGDTLAQIARDEGIKPGLARRREVRALTALHKSRKLQAFVEYHTPYYASWCAQTVERTTEMIALRREGIAERWVSRDAPTSGGTA